MLTSKITKTLDIPDEPDQTVTIRKLSHYQLMLAQDATVERAAAKMRALGDVQLPDFNKDLTPDEKVAAKAKDEAEAEQPARKYDRIAVLRGGITAWSYDAPLPDSINELDEDTAAWAFDEIMAFSIRTPDEVKASANGSQPASSAAADVGPTS